MKSGYVPVDIYAVKQYGVDRWQEEFFWPVPDNDFGKLCKDIEECLIKHINIQPEEISDLLLIQFSLRSEYWHFLHALKVIEKVKAGGREALYSDNTLWYKEIASGGPIAVTGFRKGHARSKLAKRVKAEIAKLVWSVWYNGKSLMPKGKKEIVEIFGGITPLMRAYMKKSPYLYNFTAEKDWLPDGPLKDIPDDLKSQISNVSKVIAGELVLTGRNNEIEVLDNHAAYLRELTQKMLIYTAQLVSSINDKIGNRRSIRLLTSSFVSLFSRALCISVRKKGGHVTTFNHGFAVGITDTANRPFSEFSVSDEFVTYNQKSVELMKAIKNNHSPLRGNKVSITSCDSNEIFTIWQKYKSKPVPKRIKRVMLIGCPHNQFRKYHVAGGLSLIQLDFELRIIDFLKSLGYDVFYKAHPDRLPEVRGIFDDKAKVLGGYFQKCMDIADAFLLLDTRTTAFTIALCTKKPVISILLDCEYCSYFPEPMEMLKKRCRFIHAELDERNRIIFNESELKEVLSQKPEQPNNEFIETYMFPQGVRRK